jgi:hypothetical protein
MNMKLFVLACIVPAFFSVDVYGAGDAIDASLDILEEVQAIAVTCGALELCGIPKCHACCGLTVPMMEELAPEDRTTIIHGEWVTWTLEGCYSLCVDYDRDEAEQGILDCIPACTPGFTQAEIDASLCITDEAADRINKLYNAHVCIASCQQSWQEHIDCSWSAAPAVPANLTNAATGSNSTGNPQAPLGVASGGEMVVGTCTTTAAAVAVIATLLEFCC